MSSTIKKLKIVEHKIIFNSIYANVLYQANNYDTLIFKNGNGERLAVWENGLLHFTENCNKNQLANIRGFINNHILTNVNGTNTTYLRYISVKRPNKSYFFNPIITIRDLLNKFDITEFENGDIICF